MSDIPQPPPSSNPPPDAHRSIAGAAGLIGLATFSSRILGFIRDMLLARLLGASASADAFFVAYRVPNLLRELLAEGSMSSAFIPVFTEYHTLRSKKETWELASAAFTTLLSIVTLITLIGVVVAPTIVWLLAPGFHDDPTQLEITTVLTQVMFPYLIFISVAALTMGILNSLRAFAAPALAPVFFNICVIMAALFLAPLLEEPVIGVAIGVVIGGLAQLVIQLPGVHKRGLLFQWRFEPGHPGVRRMGRLIIPSLLGMSVTQINITVNTILASYFDGGPTYLFYGMRLIQFPLGIFGVALATAILPTLSAQAAKGAMDELRETVDFGLRMIGFIILPAMAGLILLRIPLVHLFFEHGAFSSADTEGTATALLGYAVGLWAFAGIRIIVAAFYSMQDTKTPAIAAVAAMFMNILLALNLMGPLQHAGLALATALSAMLNITILIAVLTHRLHGIDWWHVGKSLGRVLIATIPVALVCMWISSLGIWQREDEWITKGILVALGIGISMGGYMGTHALYRSPELDVLWQLVQLKVLRRTS
ncbi:murein biosynthesis integral membrane protein MurJ [Candidatus Nitronereus thalassa]|uniref:Probable lipid II flippase MurJ n=1 Tax=Candidatus Nitronereus thalassa TaxID=3020898 RepID=A0ABU3K883_9BACT|nr:murein biosynthesis integral membrane protein MurJ [Candidatus Nitronereus thalassa]MDT7042655.1 murein biosynthesis integral membrane protein MurJ [Candidatus Nitronereus thalassa]